MASPYQPYQPSPSPSSSPHPFHPPPAASPAPRWGHTSTDSSGSLNPLGQTAAPPGQSSPRLHPSSHAMNNAGPYQSRGPAAAVPYYGGHHSPAQPYDMDDMYSAYGTTQNPHLGIVNPNDIDDDGDDGLEYRRRPGRNSLLSLNRNLAAASAAGAGAGAGAAMAGAGRSPSSTDLSRSPLASRERLGPPGSSSPALGSRAGAVSPGTAGASRGGPPPELEKPSAWLTKQHSNRKRWTWAIVITVALVIAAAVAGGIVAVLLRKNNAANGNSSSGSSSNGGHGQSAGDDTKSNGDLNINSPEIKSLMNNPNLHKVFPGIDYTPFNSQYPSCINNPPSQNNFTRDLAVLSQMTNVVRLYGTDCNQTQMLLHSIKQLKLQNTIKVWMGVWIDNNKTTNARQIQQMWDIFDHYGSDPFKGVIVANEIIFRKQMTVTQLGNLLSNVRNNMTAHGWNLPVATSDLGTNWDASLAAVSDYVMANIHPFFGGVPVAKAAKWTNTFWKENDGPYWKTDKSKNVISETGWPSTGGTDCGMTGATKCGANGAVAGVPELNRFMDDFVCDALNKGTQYFWFEAFDEPWKIIYDTPGKAWEDHWGLLDVDRKLKPGVKIPDCGGKTVGPA